jgi:hypothetical protein
MSVLTTDSNGIPLSTSSFSDQIFETLQEEGGTYNSGEEVDPGERAAIGVVTTRIPNSSKRNFSRPTRLGVLEARDPSGPRQSPFRPSPESWANATTEALAHLKATGVISQVPEVPKSAHALSGTTYPSPDPPRSGTENIFEISSNSHFKRVAPGVSLYSPSPSEQTGLISPSQQFQVQQSSKLVRSPSDRSTELPYRRTRENKQTHQSRNAAVYSPIPSSDYLPKHEEEDEQKPQSRAPSRSYRDEGSPCHPTSGHIDPLDDPPRYAAQSPPTPDSIADSPPHTHHHSATKTHEKQGSLTSDETILNLACYSFPAVPFPTSHRLLHILPALQHSPQNRHMEELVASVEREIQQSRWDCERSRDDYPLNPPPYGTTQSPGREPINPGALYRSQRYQAERGFPSTQRDDPLADRMSSSPAPASSPSPYRSQDPRASPAPRGRLGEHRTFPIIPVSSESRPISPEIDPTRLQNYRDDATANRRLGAIAEDVPPGRQLPSAGHSSGYDRSPTAEHVGHFHLRRVRSRHRDLSLRGLSIPATPPPPIPPSNHPDEHDSHRHGDSEPRQVSAFEDQYSSNYGSHPATHSSTATVATHYDGTSAVASTVQPRSQPSTIGDPQDEQRDRMVNVVSGRAHHAGDVRASSVLGEYQREEDVTSDRDVKARGRGTVGAAYSGGPGRTVSNSPSSLTNITATVSKEVNISQVPQPVVAPLIRPARSLRNLNAEDEAPLHIDELNVPPRKPLSRMEKALLRRVEFGSLVDYTTLRVT